MVPVLFLFSSSHYHRLFFHIDPIPLSDRASRHPPVGRRQRGTSYAVTSRVFPADNLLFFFLFFFRDSPIPDRIADSKSFPKCPNDITCILCIQNGSKKRQRKKKRRQLQQARLLIKSGISFLVREKGFIYIRNGVFTF